MRSTTSLRPLLALHGAAIALLIACGDDSSSASSSGSSSATGTGGAASTAAGTGGAPPDFVFPSLASSAPEEGDLVPTTTWLTLEFSDAVATGALPFLELTCDGADHLLDASLLESTVVIVNPRSPLPESASCTLSWPTAEGTASLAVTVAGPGDPAVVPYDRDDDTLIAPLPDDWYLEEDPDTATGRRLALRVPDRPSGVQTIFDALIEPTAQLDGQSASAPFVIDVPIGVTDDTLPLTVAASLDPLSTIALVDIGPSSPRYLERVPFELQRKVPIEDDAETEQLAILPAATLEPNGVYALVVTRRALVDVSRPLAPSEFTEACLGPSSDRGGSAEAVGAITDDVLDALGEMTPPIFADDVALLLRSTIGSGESVGRDLASIREQLSDADPPAYTIVSVDTPEDGPAAAIVRGTWMAPQFRDGDWLARDEAGEPLRTEDVELSFVLALPPEPLGARAPIIVYQHGQPGSAEEIDGGGQDHLLEAGFAVIGFTDPLNRQNATVAQQTASIFAAAVVGRRPPDTIALLANAEQLAFVRLIAGMGDLDVLPIDDPDGEPELDVDAPLGYWGVSAGAVHGLGLLPFAPEIRSASLTVGGGRWSGLLIHQDREGSNDAYEFVADAVDGVTRSEFFAGVSIVQMAMEGQEPLQIAGLLRDVTAGDRASVLLTVGLGDRSVPVSSSGAAAYAIGLEHLAPAVEELPFLDLVEGPLQGNLGEDWTGALFQYVPSGIDGIDASPGCEDLPSGHACPQLATGSYVQRVELFSSALDGVPRVIAP